MTEDSVTKDVRVALRFDKTRGQKIERLQKKWNLLTRTEVFDRLIDDGYASAIQKEAARA